jgi:PAS domain S-box-containing protein
MKVQPLFSASPPEGGEFASTDLLQAIPVAVYTTDAEGRITFYNDAAAELWGSRPVLGESQWCGSWRLFHLDGRPMQHDECPMAIAIREQREVRWEQAIAERPDGSRVAFMAFPTPLRDRSGKIVGAINTLIDRSEHERAGEASMRLSAIVESSSDAIISKNLDSTITSWNGAAERLFGYTAEEAIGRSVTMLIPAGRRDEETEIIERIRRGERIETYETIRQRKDGSLVPVSLTVSPVRDGFGRIVGASKIVRDVSSHRDSEQRIRLLMREVNHRVKNQYAVILSMIRETNKRSKTPGDFERQVRERIMALSLSHDLLVLGDWKGTTVFELLLAQLKPFGNEDRVTISGPSLKLRPNAVQYLGIAFHELATNSAKYGALSESGGRVGVEWKVTPEPDGSQRFGLAWRESGAPAITDRTRGGFGTVVLERIAPQAVSGTGCIEYQLDGIVWTLDAPLDQVEASLDDKEPGQASAGPGLL